MVLAEVCILTNNVPGMSDFYKKILMTGSDSDDIIHQELKTEGAALTLYNDGELHDGSTQNIAVAFTVGDVDKEYERLINEGIKIIEPPQLRPWGAKNMRLKDPDGNSVYFRSFPE